MARRRSEALVPAPRVSARAVAAFVERYADAVAREQASESERCRAAASGGELRWPDQNAVHGRALLACLEPRHFVELPVLASYRLPNLHEALRRVVHGAAADAPAPHLEAWAWRQRMMALVLATKAVQESPHMWGPAGRGEEGKAARARAGEAFTAACEALGLAEKAAGAALQGKAALATHGPERDELVACPMDGDAVSALLTCGVCPWRGPSARTCRWPFVEVFRAALARPPV